VDMSHGPRSRMRPPIVNGPGKAQCRSGRWAGEGVDVPGSGARVRRRSGGSAPFARAVTCVTPVVADGASPAPAGGYGSSNPVAESRNPVTEGGTGTAHFIPEATSAVWDGDVLTVTFQEAGLVADAVTTVSVAGEAAADAVFVRNDEVVFSLHSHSAVADESAYPVSADGTTGSTVVLRLTAGVAAADGKDCTMNVNRSFSVTVRDLDTGAAVFITGSAASDQPFD